MKIAFHNSLSIAPSLKEHALEKAKELANLVSGAEGFYKIFCSKSCRQQISDFQSLAQTIADNFSDVIIVAMGGATLNPQSVIGLCRQHITQDISLHFLDSTDPINFHLLLDKIDIEHCAILAISNSGNTSETNSLLGALLHHFQSKNIQDFANRVFCITNPNSGELKDIASNIGARIIPHIASISGRFSGLTAVATFPGSIVSLDMREYLDGAEATIQDFISQGEIFDQALESATILSMQKSTIAHIGYLQQYEKFLEWYCQIIAESMGKTDSAPLPIRGLGPADQHSMLQLYLQGPRDKSYHFFSVKNLGQDTKIMNFSPGEQVQHYSLADVHKANLLATASSLIEQNSMVQERILEDLSPQNVGALVTFSMLEVILACHLTGVNPFNQPGVQIIKNKISAIIK